MINQNFASEILFGIKHNFFVSEWIPFPGEMEGGKDKKKGGRNIGSVLKRLSHDSKSQQKEAQIGLYIGKISIQYRKTSNYGASSLFREWRGWGFCGIKTKRGEEK